MRVSINSLWLTNDGTTDLRSWTDAHDVQLNGRQVVQEAHFLRAVSALPLARGNAANVLRFSVTRQHATAAEASAWILTAFSTLPTSGTVQVVCGAYGESPVTCTFAAVLEEIPGGTFHGTRSDMTFVLRGGAIMSTASATGGVDGAQFATSYVYPQGGTIDGGAMGDALSPGGLVLDGGGW